MSCFGFCILDLSLVFRNDFGAWPSGSGHVLWEHGIVGSNPTAPTSPRQARAGAAEYSASLSPSLERAALSDPAEGGGIEGHVKY